MEADRGVVGALLVLLGVYYLVVAHRHQRFAHYPSAFLTWFALVYMLCTLLHPPVQAAGHGGNIRRRAIYLAIAILQGVSMMLVTSCLLTQGRGRLWTVFGRVCLGGLSGSALSFYLLAMSRDGGLVQHVGGRAAIAVVCAVIMTITLLYLPGRMFSACSSILGSYILVLGVDCFARTGYMNHLAVITKCRLDVEYHAERSAMLLQAVALVLAMLGGFIQRFYALLRFRNVLANR
ncbi:hypothetical protein GGI19_003346 [Coemansia pectinata]|uniref:TM7S3/TM198-like domain-containing protein n=1 Tax=Coemansia pectinata TaxID=1052879 RepID=A0A9W8LB14_9FUNG|nr:hypothetical protein GGI19_003346 [Coemansia pectinata]